MGKGVSSFLLHLAKAPGLLTLVDHFCTRAFEKTSDFGFLHSILWTSMGDISQILAVTRREHSDSFSSDATQSTASRLALRHRLNQLMTCLDDLDPSNDLHDKVVKTLDNAFVVCGTRASKPKKDKFRWREYLYLSYRNSFTVLIRISFVVELSCCCWFLWTHDYCHYLLFMVPSWFLCFCSTVLLLYWLWQCWCVLLWFRPYSMKPFQELKFHLFIWRFLRFRLTLFELDIKHAAQYLFFCFFPQATCCHVECGHSWASRWCVLAAPSELAKECRPLHHWVQSSNWLLGFSGFCMCNYWTRMELM